LVTSNTTHALQQKQVEKDIRIWLHVKMLLMNKNKKNNKKKIKRTIIEQKTYEKTKM